MILKYLQFVLNKRVSIATIGSHCGYGSPKMMQLLMAPAPQPLLNSVSCTVLYAVKTRIDVLYYTGSLV
jgi:hypothetical protein